jgi:two-component system cell cycle response regulator
VADRDPRRAELPGERAERVVPRSARPGLERGARREVDPEPMEAERELAGASLDQRHLFPRRLPQAVIDRSDLERELELGRQPREHVEHRHRVRTPTDRDQHALAALDQPPLPERPAHARQEHGGQRRPNDARRPVSRWDARSRARRASERVMSWSGMSDKDATTVAPPTGTRVLVVDDSATARLAVRALLETHGCIVETASSGEEAVEACERMSFDAVVTDLTMGPLGGVQLCRVLRSAPATSDVPVIMLTATDHRRHRFWARNAGADAYVAKDAMHADLPGVVAKLRRTGPPRTPAARGVRPLERLSTLLEEMLFSAVLSTEVHRLVAHLEDRRALAKALVMLAGEVVDAPYMVAATNGTEGVLSAVLVRGAWPDHAVVATLGALGIADARRAEVVLETTRGGSSVEVGEVNRHPIVVGEETLGEIRAYGGRTRVGARDRDTLALLARESALVLKGAALSEHARALARIDPLTGVANRRATTERLAHEIERARRRASSFAIALLDVDHFKQVNDKHGHGVGDDVLKAVADALSRTVRTVDLVGRWGGEEFLLVLTDAADTGARIAAERMRLGVEKMAQVPGGPARVTASVGVATWAGESEEELVERVDRALYRAKSRGRNRVEMDLPGKS